MLLFLLKSLNSSCQLCTNHSQLLRAQCAPLVPNIVPLLVGSPPGTGEGTVKRRVSPVL